MELRGELVHITRDLKSGKMWITFGVEEIPPEVNSLQVMPLTITVKKYRKKRSLDANAYYWQLIEKISAAVGNAKPVVHNMMLRRYGVLKQIDGENLLIFLPDTDEAQKKAFQDEFYHFKPTSLTKIADDGRVFRAYLLLKGSHEMDSQEMSALIDGAVMEAKDLGIETLPPIELERMKKAYEEHTATK